MIELKVEEYCHNCLEFEARCARDSFVTPMRVLYSNTVITCEHAGRCASMMKYLENTHPKPEPTTPGLAKSAELCNTCVYNFYRDICNGGLGCVDADNITCPVYSDCEMQCRCLTIENGDPCSYFKEAE